MDNNIFQLGVELDQAMFVLLDPSRVIQDQAHDFDDLGSRAASIFWFQFAEAAVHNHIIVIVWKEFALGVRIGH